MAGIIATSDGDGFMPETARTDCMPSQPIAPSSAPLGLTLSPSIGPSRAVGDDGRQPPVT